MWVRYSVRPAPEQHREGVELEAGVILLSGLHTQASASSGAGATGTGFLQAPGAHVEEEHAAGVTFF